ncbi:hypothetical protein C1645_849727 [Glomus cerebriforme]|uniref:P-loop containing nucleoside triphosphate hydrolase protein n=1 Tax=Glomus cerebriforme TaxID=658196 RepID=A0A397S2C0_9GLOM|nr:hypothetical protein C1645_849727 [Glomus cerebriforme]
MLNIDDPDNLNLWKVSLSYDLKDINTEEQIKNKGEGLVPINYFMKYFSKQDEADKNLIFIQVPATTELRRKRPITEEKETKTAKRRKWAVNSTITKEERPLAYFIEPNGNDPLFEMIIQKREYVVLYGARASGKSTRVQRFRELLSLKGYVCIYVGLELINLDFDVCNFWTSLGICLIHDISENYCLKSISYFDSVNDLHIKSAIDFIDIFKKSNWKKNNVVLFIDEFDKLYDSDVAVKSSCLETLRGIKNTKENYAFWCMVAIGTFSIIHLESGKISTSPFNIREPFLNPNFTFEHVQFLFKEFEKDNTLTIEPKVIEDIYKKSNGHASLVCLCGRRINNNLIKHLGVDRRLSFENWSTFVTKHIDSEIVDYSTFRKMVNNLNTLDKFKPPMDLLRSVFIGVFNFMPIYDDEELRLAEVLSRPTISVPRMKDGFLKTLDILREAIHCFDKTIISNAYNRSFKTALVPVDSYRNVKVPRESVYDTELNRILINWVVKECNFQVTGQWHLIDHTGNNQKDKHYYSDIVIVTPLQTVVLELLATPTINELDKHFERVLDYAEILSADDIWIVNFTCEDDVTKEPHWPPNDGKFERVNVVHFFHNQKFENVRMSARYISNPGAFSYITDQVIQLQ